MRENLIGKIKGLGEKGVTNLKKIGVITLYDLLYYFPRTYEDRTNLKKIGDLVGEEYVVLNVKLLSIDTPPTRTKISMTRARVTDGTGILEVIWFKMPFLKRNLKLGEQYILAGHVKKGYNFQLMNPDYKKYNENQNQTEILPIYSISKEIQQYTLRKFIKEAILNYIGGFEENIPQEILAKYNIMGRKEALKEIHFPTSRQKLEEAKRRFSIEELLVLEMGILQKRYEVDIQNKEQYFLENKKELVKKYLENLHFKLTIAQKKVVTDIYKELNAGRIINRLIQGDVGSGKTVVSMILLLYMVENGYQGALMAPTEILATQHYLSIKNDFEKLGIKVELFTGSLRGKNKEKKLEELRDGIINIAIGTHALIEENIEFKNLGLIIIDEQHRFGVIQRKRLRDKGVLANLIVMSATPIPRSLALSIYGDLDVSIIDELPPGRKEIRTKWISTAEDYEKMYNFIRKKLNEGRQAYFVAPLIEESEKLSSKSIEKMIEEIRYRLPEFKSEILHGKMKNSEKDTVMKDFKEKRIDILVSTTVVEVGVNVPNATIMVINDAERFGLSALHQLRGRVGRGEEQSYCFLISGTQNDTSKARLRIMENIQDGFKIAEEDLKLRKAGEIFGTKQSGFSDLKFIDIIQDIKTIKLVREICIEYLKEHNGKIENFYLKEDIESRFKER